MSNEIHDWKSHLSEAREICKHFRERGHKPAMALVSLGIRQFGDETWRETHRLIAKAIWLRSNEKSRLLVVQDQGTYGEVEPEA